VPNDEVLEIRYFETRELPGLFDEQRLTIGKMPGDIENRNEMIS